MEEEETRWVFIEERRGGFKNVGTLTGKLSRSEQFSVMESIVFPFALLHFLSLVIFFY